MLTFSNFLFKLPQRKNPAMLLFQCTGLKLSIAQMKNDWMNKRGISIWQKCTRWSWTNAAFFPASGNYCSTNLSLDYYHKELEVILSRSVFHTQIICFCVWGSRSSAYFSGQLFSPMYWRNCELESSAEILSILHQGNSANTHTFTPITLKVNPKPK